MQEARKIPHWKKNSMSRTCGCAKQSWWHLEGSDRIPDGLQVTKPPKKHLESRSLRNDFKEIQPPGLISLTFPKRSSHWVSPWGLGHFREVYNPVEFEQCNQVAKKTWDGLNSVLGWKTKYNSVLDAYRGSLLLFICEHKYLIKAPPFKPIHW